MKPSVQWIHAEYGTARSSNFGGKQSLIKRALGIVPQTIVVQNDTNVSLTSNRHIHGSNRLREFSAWDEGVHASRERGITPDWWIFSNDTFSHHRFFWGAVLAGFVRTFAARQGATEPVIIGDVLPGSLLADPSAQANYVSTYFFMINAAGLERLAWNLTQDVPLNWVASSADISVAAPACPARVKTFLYEHLCDPGSPRAWRSASPVTADNKDFIRFKATAILLEHALSHRALQNGVSLLPIIDRRSVNPLRLIRSVEARFSRFRSAITSKATYPANWRSKSRGQAPTGGNGNHES